MCECVQKITTSSTIIKIIANDSISDNHMRHRNIVQNHNDPFSINELNWRKKLSSSNYQHHHPHHSDKNQALLRAHARCCCRYQSHSTVANRRYCRRCHRRCTNNNTSTNWINIRRVKAIRANRCSQPIHTTQYSDSEHHTRTNLDVHFEWNSRIYFSISPKIYSR